jgi:hypothetical protein
VLVQHISQGIQVCVESVGVCPQRLAQPVNKAANEIVADRSREALCERRAPRCERGCESLLTSPTGPHGGAVAGDLNAGFDVDGFIARIDSGEID